MVGRSLQEAIAVAKVHGVEESIEQCFRLKQEVCFVVTVTTALFFVFNHARPSPSAISQLLCQNSLDPAHTNAVCGDESFPLVRACVVHQDEIALLLCRSWTRMVPCMYVFVQVGSYALMAGSGFEQSDFLQCCKFAEGDSRILMLKMARDRLSQFRKNAAAIPEVRWWCVYHPPHHGESCTCLLAYGRT